MAAFLTPRLRLPFGPIMQKAGPGVWVKSQGNYFGVGAPGSGPQATSGLVVDANTVEIRFSQCVSISGNTGIELQIDSGAWVQVTGYLKVDDTTYRFTSATVVEAGDVVRWRYVGGSDTIQGCESAEDIGDQEIPVSNPLVLAGNLVLLETGGTAIVLLEDDIDQSNGVELEDAP